MARPIVIILLVGVRKVKGFLSSSYMKIFYGVVAVAVLIFIILVIRLNMALIKKRKVRYIPMRKREKNRYDK